MRRDIALAVATLLMGVFLGWLSTLLHSIGATVLACVRALVGIYLFLALWRRWVPLGRSEEDRLLDWIGLQIGSGSGLRERLMAVNSANPGSLATDVLEWDAKTDADLSRRSPPYGAVYRSYGGQSHKTYRKSPEIDEGLCFVDDRLERLHHIMKLVSSQQARGD